LYSSTILPENRAEICKKQENKKQDYENCWYFAEIPNRGCLIMIMRHYAPKVHGISIPFGEREREREMARDREFPLEGTLLLSAA
jgi:hypothetical protein